MRLKETKREREKIRETETKIDSVILKRERERQSERV